jgi:cytochrome P450
MVAPDATDYQHYVNEPNCVALDDIPGDYGLPILGHSLRYLRDPLPWAQQRYQQYGPLSKVCTTGTKALLCLGPDLAQQIFLDPGRDFSSRMGFHHRIVKFFGGSLIMEDFEHHRFQRRIAQAAFKNDSLRHYTDEINRIYHRALGEWQADVGETIPFFLYIKRLLLEVAAEIFVGETERGERVQQLSRAFTDCVDGLMYMLPLNVPGTVMHKGLKGREYLEGFFGELVPRKRQGEGLDILSHFCREKDENGEFFSDKNITNQIIFLLFAAHDTTTSAITHTIYYLARHPEIKAKLYEECRSLGSDQLGYDDLNALPYMQQVFNEVQRIRPSVPAIPRRTIRDVEMAGYRVPAHTMLTVLPRFSHWMEEYWTAPLDFDPDRFSPERAEHKKHPFQFHPFGGGAHKCIGIHFSQMEYKCFMYQFMLRYDFEGCHQQPDVYMQSFPLPKPSDDMPIVLRNR